MNRREILRDLDDAIRAKQHALRIAQSESARFTRAESGYLMTHHSASLAALVMAREIVTRKRPGIIGRALDEIEAVLKQMLEPRP